jgi:hypothetical protein
VLLVAGTPRTKKEPTPEELARFRLKEEVAKSLGLWDKVASVGWGGLTAAESGRVGAVLARRLREDAGTG